MSVRRERIEIDRPRAFFIRHFRNFPESVQRWVELSHDIEVKEIRDTSGKEITKIRQGNLDITYRGATPKKQVKAPAKGERQIAAEPPTSSTYRPIIDVRDYGIVPVKNEASLVDYVNEADRNLNVQVMRCKDWTEPLERTGRMGHGVPHPEPVRTAVVTKSAWRVNTWKGSRLKNMEPYYADPPEDYVQVNIPRTFSFRWSQLDQYFAFLTHMKNELQSVRMGYVGDSTMVRLRHWLKCWPTSHRNTVGAIQFSADEAQHLKSGTSQEHLNISRTLGGRGEVLGKIKNITSFKPVETCNPLNDKDPIPVNLIPEKQDIECTVLYQNINGWSRKKQDNAFLILREKGIDIFAVAEHKKKRKQDLPNFMGYDRWATCRENENGGGVCVWVKKGKFTRTCTIPLKPVRKEIEEDQLWVGMDTGHKRIALGIIYVRPVGGHCTKEDLIERMQVINIRTLEMQKQGFDVILLRGFQR